MGGAAGPTTVGGQGRIRPLDGLRGFAVTAVVVYHFSGWAAPGGFLGVDVFFVLSGFLITSLLVAEWQRRATIHLSGFWLRRARRLLPALFLVLAAVGLYALLDTNAHESGRLTSDGLAALGYFANWHFIASGQSYIERFIGIGPSPLRHTWSLAIEEQFYLLWPLVVLTVGAAVVAIGRRRAFRWTLATVCALLAAASAVEMAVLYRPGADPSRVYYGTDTRVHVLLVGALLGAVTAGALVIRSRAAAGTLKALGAAAAVTLVALCATVRTTSSWLYRGGFVGLGLLVVLVIVGSNQPGWNPLRSALSWRPLVALGLISYGVYLWHWPIEVWLTSTSTGIAGPELFAVRVGVTLGLALASYLLVEQPIRRGALRRWRPAIVRRAVPVVAVAALAALMIVPASASGPSTPRTAPPPPPPARTVDITEQYAGASRCDSVTTELAGQSTPMDAQVQLVGNSIAAEIAPCLTTILRSDGIQLTTLIHDAWGVCDLLHSIRAELRDPATRPQAVVLFALPVVLTACSRSEHWDDQLQSALALWSAAGVPVYLPPPPGQPGTTDDGALGFAFQVWSNQNPGEIHLLEAGTFLRDATGLYAWRMPCVAPNEAGCGPDGTVVVRLLRDGGQHFCADNSWDGVSPCNPADAGGERRVAAAIAAGLEDADVGQGG